MVQKMEKESSCFNNQDLRNFIILKNSGDLESNTSNDLFLTEDKGYKIQFKNYSILIQIILMNLFDEICMG